jgi:hypothetical protein
MVTMNARVWAMDMRQDGNCEGMAGDAPGRSGEQGLMQLNED